MKAARLHRRGRRGRLPLRRPRPHHRPRHRRRPTCAPDQVEEVAGLPGHHRRHRPPRRLRGRARRLLRRGHPPAGRPPRRRARRRAACEGDPLFYGSYMHLHERLAPRFRTEIVPGVTSVSAASAALGQPLVERDEVLTVLPGTLPRRSWRARLADTDAAAVLKLGRTFTTVRDAVADAGRPRRPYVERATTDRRAHGRARRRRPGVGALLRDRAAARRGGGGAPTNPPGGAWARSPSSAPAPPGGDWTHPAGRGGGRRGRRPRRLRPLPRPRAARPAPAQARRATTASRRNGPRTRSTWPPRARGSRWCPSGDPGVFAMAAAVLEVAAQPKYVDVDVRVLPGVTAAERGGQPRPAPRSATTTR